VKSGVWHELAIEARGDHFIYFDDLVATPL